MKSLVRAATLGATALLTALGAMPAQAARVVPFTFSAANGSATTSGSGSFTTAVNIGKAGLKDVTAFSLNGGASVFGGLFSGNYSFAAGDLTRFKAVLGAKGVTALSFATDTNSFPLSFLGFLPAGSGSLAFDVSGLDKGNLTVTSPLPDATGTLRLGAVAAVPEPATWAMMIGGVGLVGGALRRRRTVPVRTALA